ncbi:MAG: PD-(D/E)XK nuclease family protein [Poseidonibacter sp.]|uniref:PDDEXK-like family protein n=1 Tax=Poseidonibacter sp. TaxID=2321188 RepID=UPI00359E43DE
MKKNKDFDYINLFENIKNFKEKQSKQKQRGLNDYNLLTTVLNAHDEVRLHSRVIGSMLDIDGLHYQGTLFLEKFFEVLNIKDFEFDVNKSSLNLEYQNIDLYLTDGQKHIIIENKVYADDQKNQIKRYINIIKDENKNLQYNDILVIYLSINKKKPSKYSLDNLSILENLIYNKEDKITLFKNINYGSEVIEWLKVCLHEIQNITNLNESILQYLAVVEKVTNKYKEKVMPLKNLLLENDNLKLITDLEESVKDAKAQVQYDFWISLREKLNSIGHDFKLIDGNFKEIDLKEKVKNFYHNKQNNRYFGLKKDIFKINDKYTLSFYIEVDWNIVYGFTVSENGKRKEISQNKEFEDLSNKILNNTDFKWHSTNKSNNQKWWICWKYLERKIDFNSFNTPIVFDLVDEHKRNIITKNIAIEINNVIKTIAIDK